MKKIEIYTMYNRRVILQFWKTTVIPVQNKPPFIINSTVTKENSLLIVFSMKDKKRMIAFKKLEIWLLIVKPNREHPVINFVKKKVMQIFLISLSELLKLINVRISVEDI